MALYCDTPLPAYQEDICAVEPSRIIAVAFIRSDNTFTDFTSASQWSTNQTAGTAVVIRNVRGNKDKSSVVEIDGFGKQQTRTVGYDRQITYEHADVVDNVDFYDVLNFDSAHSVAFYTQGGRLFVNNNLVSVDADFIIPTELNNQIIFNVVVKWAEKEMAQPFVGPASIFEISS